MFKLLYVFVYLYHLLRDIDALRTMANASATPYAVICLSQARHAAVVANKKFAAQLGIVLAAGHGQASLVLAFVVVNKYGRDVDAVGTWHTVFAVITGDGLKSHYLLCYVGMEKLHLLFVKGLQRTVR